MSRATTTTPSGVYVHTASIDLSTSVHTEFADYYAIMGLDNWATSEEIKTAYRRLCSEYFATNPQKYRALQAAFDVLADKDSRRDYDIVYRQRRGLPPPPPRLSSVHTHAQVLEKSEEEDDQHTLSAPLPVEAYDPNRYLKLHKAGEFSMVGKHLHGSFIPILEAYEGGHTHASLMCYRPRYIAKGARVWNDCIGGIEGRRFG